MTASSSDVKKIPYPFPAYSYIVEFGPDTVAFSEVSGLTMSYETTVYKESPTVSGKPGPVKMVMPAQSAEVKVTLKKGVVIGSSFTYLYKWISQIKGNQVEKKEVTVRLCDEYGIPVLSWVVRGAFPISLDGPIVNASSKDPAIQILQLIGDSLEMYTRLG